MSDALKVLGVALSPLKVKDKYCCHLCTAKARDLYSSHLALIENRKSFEHAVSPESYLGIKHVLQDDSQFNTPRKGLIRLSEMNTSPVKRRNVCTQQSPRQSHAIYSKATYKKGKKVTLNLNCVNYKFAFDHHHRGTKSYMLAFYI